MSSYMKEYLRADTSFQVDDLIKKLIIKVTKLEKELYYYKNIETVLIQENHNLLSFDISSSPMLSLIDIKNNYKNHYTEKGLAFMTITFDPMRFDKLELSTEQSQKDYILTMLSKASKKADTYSEFIYGCFEKHKSGIIHAHCLYECEDYVEVKKYLQRKFSNSIHNQKAVDINWVRNNEKVFNYIDDGNKEKYGFFLLDKRADLDKITF